MSNYQHLTFSVDNSIGHLTLNRPNKKNAINDALCLEIEQVFINMPKDVSVILFSGNGPEFCSGLDLSEHTAREPFEVVVHSRMWHRVFSHISNSGIPIVAALHGAVIGGGLELAICAHVRVSDETTFYRLPEGRHGIFVGGGASVRVAQTIGHGRMTEMMLTGRTLNAADGERLGLAHYVVPKGTAMEKAQELAETIATNSRLSNWAMASGLARINNMASDDGLFTESLLTGITQTSGEVKERIDAFLNRKKSS
ncbi:MULTISPECIES: crotonase/enoyl-CoA hydratase family protein [Oceanospirillaceae]|jgi:enoyl-CoA hydratase/carnithine racemase|uniref:Crotonase/enoyl-CoA hydratase family protein n=1 Tax=Oceanobacter antarcticus TaxID=3133425 RepID=A0ABW8NMI5_9GAMM|tara:strand:+ start:1955 stop:2719 length:765 start_codon:yes stop_codon:yes gene_type:complete